MLPRPATSSTICIGSAYCRSERPPPRLLSRASANRFGPYVRRRSSACDVLRPRCSSTSSAARVSGIESVWKSSCAGTAARVLVCELVMVGAPPPAVAPRGAPRGIVVPLKPNRVRGDFIRLG